MSEERRKKKPMIVRPGVDRTAGFGGQYSPVETYSRPRVDEKLTDALKEPAPAAKPAPAQEREAEKPAPPATKKAAPSRKPALSRPKPADGERKMVSLTVYPKLEHKEQLEAFAADGLRSEDIIKAAGRRALAAFEPESGFVEAPDVQRMSADYRYTTTKKIGTKLLETLHKAHDPLHIKSDNALLRGQFEPLFWSKLDEVIQELNTSKRG